MKITHKFPTPQLTANMTGKLTPEYEREVEQSTARLEQQYLQAQKSFAAAERRAMKKAARVANERTKASGQRAKREVQLAWLQVEERRRELNALSRLMTTTPASAKNRGTSSWKPVPNRHGGII